MYPFRALVIVRLLPVAAAILLSDAAQAGDDWVRELGGRHERGTLHDSHESVRGDSGKWSDADVLLLAPSIEKKPQRMAVDEWIDELQQQPRQLAGDEDRWLLFRSGQLDDNDRLWIERIERQGNQLTVVAVLAKWQGWYQKNFTYYEVLGVNIGRLAPGDYVARWIIKPYEFEKFEQPGQPRDNWPANERATDGKPAEHVVRFSVGG